MENGEVMMARRHFFFLCFFFLPLVSAEKTLFWPSRGTSSFLTVFPSDPGVHLFCVVCPSPRVLLAALAE